MSYPISIFASLGELKRKTSHLINYLQHQQKNELILSNEQERTLLMSYPCQLAEEILESIEQIDDFVFEHMEYKNNDIDNHDVDENHDEFESEQPLPKLDSILKEAIPKYEDNDIDIHDVDEEYNEDNTLEEDAIQTSIEETTSYPLLYDAYQGPFKDCTNSGRFSLGGINDRFGPVLSLESINHPYIKELHQYIIQNIVDILNGKDIEWEGPIPEFDIRNKHIKINFFELKLEERIGKDLIDKSPEMLHHLAYKFLDKEDYTDFCINYIEKYIDEFKIDLYFETQEKDKAIKFATKVFKTSIAKKLIHKKSQQGKVNFLEILSSLPQEDKIETAYIDFFNLHIDTQTNSETRQQFIENVKNISEIKYEPEVWNDLEVCFYYEKEERLFLSLESYNDFLKEHQKQELDIIISKINVQEHRYCIISPQDLEHYKYENYVFETDKNIFWKIFPGKRYQTIEQNLNYIRLADYIREISFYLKENNVEKFSTETILPFEYPTKKRRMMDIAAYAAANIFILTGIAIIPGRIKYSMIQYKKELANTPELNVVDYYKTMIQNNQETCLTIDKRAVENNTLSDEIIKAMFLIED